MNTLTAFRELNSRQRSAFIAAFLGWALDAFDYFVLVFVMKDVAATFHVDKVRVSFALMLTLACRPIGAFIFGAAADRYGRRVPLMINVVCYSAINLVSGFAPTLTIFLVLRALFGVAMGGEWGLGAALAMESVPEKHRGVLSGLLQEGYVVGYLLAAVLYPIIFPAFGWRAMFFVGVLPALLSLYIRSRVTEPERAVSADPALRQGLGQTLRANFRVFCYLVLLMTAFNFMSHGTQDVYPTFLQVQRKFTPAVVSRIAIVYNIGALCGGIFFGGLSQRIGRRKAIVTAALLAIPMVPLWAYAPSAVGLAVAAFCLQFCVQGAWGVIPAHLSELAPAAARSTFIGFSYQLGNLFASVNAPLQTSLAKSHGGNYSYALSLVVAIVLVAVACVTLAGKDGARGAPLA